MEREIAQGILIYGAVALAGLMAGGITYSGPAFLCGLIAAAAAYLTQMFGVFSLTSASKTLFVCCLFFWGVSVLAFLVGFFNLVGVV